MAGINIAESCHVCSILVPHDITGGAHICAPVDMTNYAHCTIVLNLGVTGAAATITVEEVATVGGVGVAIDFAYYVEDTALGNVLGPRVAGAAVGFATSLNNDIFYTIEIDAAQLSDESHYIELNISNPGVATLASAVAILTGARYANPESPTAIV